jgi:hypothetical protein
MNCSAQQMTYSPVSRERWLVGMVDQSQYFAGLA